MINAPLYSIRTIKNLKDMLDQSERLFGGKDAFLLKLADGSYKGVKYSKFKKDVDALGTALIGNLDLKGSNIAVIGENRYEWCVTYLAAVNGTGVVVPLDKELPIGEIENLLLRSNASAIIFSGKYAKEMKKISASLSSVKYFINMDAEQDEQGFLSYKELLRKGSELMLAGNRSFIDAEIDEEAMSILLFTSGTTDLAKGVMLSHKNLCSNIMATCSVLYIDSTDSFLSILPIHHTYECTNGFLLMVYSGCTIAFCEGLKHISKNLKEVKPTILLLVPLILESMYKKIWEQAGKKHSTKVKLKAALFASDFLYKALKVDVRRKLFKQIHESLGGRIRLVISGAAAINPQVSNGLRSLGFSVLQGYGLTESSPILSVNREGFFSASSVGIALPGVEINIDSPDNDGIGEIIARGDNIMLGYYENNLATEKVLKNGWLYTGDLGRIDKDGFLYITGRKKNVIITKNGKNIFPEEVEAYLNKSPYILESLIWGKYDESSGDTLVSAQIVPDFEAIKDKLKINELSDEDVFRVINSEVRSVNRSISLYKHIKAFTIRKDEFSKTTTKKIRRYIEKIS